MFPQIPAKPEQNAGCLCLGAAKVGGQLFDAVAVPVPAQEELPVQRLLLPQEALQGILQRLVL